MQSQVQEKFVQFFEKWLLQRESNLQKLLSISRDPSQEQEHRSFVSKVMNNYKEYYTVKWAGAHEDVLGFYSPSWLSPLENAHFWLTDWKPSMLYRLIHSLTHAQLPRASLTNLTEQQLEKIQELRLQTRMEEDKVERDMERQQVSIAERRMVELAQLANRVRLGEMDGLVDVALKSLLAGLERVMKFADCVRLKALKSVLEVLTPLQSVDFMAAVLIVQIQMRKLGKSRDTVSVDLTLL